MATTQKILCAGYFWPSIFKDCIEAVKKCPPCQFFHKKARTHLAPLHPIIAIDPFSKWGIDFMQPLLSITSQNGLRLCLLF
jgi:hypothetical protein